jgi:hypothetical protein
MAIPPASGPEQNIKHLNSIRKPRGISPSRTALRSGKPCPDRKDACAARAVSQAQSEQRDILRGNAVKLFKLDIGATKLAKVA